MRRNRSDPLWSVHSNEGAWPRGVVTRLKSADRVMCHSHPHIRTHPAAGRRMSASHVTGRVSTRFIEATWSFSHVQNGRRSNWIPAAVKMASIFGFDRRREGSTCSDDMTAGDADEKWSRKPQPGFLCGTRAAWMDLECLVWHSAIVFCLLSRPGALWLAADAIDDSTITRVSASIKRFAAIYFACSSLLCASARCQYSLSGSWLTLALD